MKYIPLTIIVLGIAIFLVMLLGCSAGRSAPEFKPLPPERLFDNLLHEDGLQNIAYKSVTKEDYEAKDEC